MIEAKTNVGTMTLHIACNEGREEIARMLLFEGKMNVNIRDQQGKTPLHFAFFNGHGHVARMLVFEAHAKVDIQDYDDETPLQCAFEHLAKQILVIRDIIFAPDINIHTRCRISILRNLQLRVSSDAPLDYER